MREFLAFRLPCGCRMDAEQRQLCGLHAIQYQADQDRAERRAKADPSHGAEPQAVVSASRREPSREYSEPAWSPYP